MTPRAVRVLALGQWGGWAALYYCVSVLGVAAAKQAGRPESAGGAAMSLTLIVAAIAAPFVGHWIDRRSARGPMIGGALLGAALLFTASFIHSAAILTLLVAALGVAYAGALYEPAFATVDRWCEDPAVRDHALITLTVAGGLAVLAASVAGWGIEQAGWRSVARLIAVFLLVFVGGVNWLAWHLAPRGRGRPPVHAALRRWPRTDRLFVAIAAAVAAGSAVSTAGFIHVVAMVHSRGEPLRIASLALTVMGLAQIPSRLAYAPLRGAHGAGRVLVISLAVQGAGLVLLAAFRSTPAAFGGAALMGAGNGLGTVSRAAAVRDVLAAESYATISGTLSFISGIARAAGATLTSALILTAGYGAAFAPLGVILAVSMVWLAWVMAPET